VCYVYDYFHDNAMQCNPCVLYKYTALVKKVPAIAGLPGLAMTPIIQPANETPTLNDVVFNACRAEHGARAGNPYCLGKGFYTGYGIGVGVMVFFS
jgi:hypothetical protein